MLLKNACIFTPTKDFLGDIRFSNEKILEVAESIKPSKDEQVYDLRGCWVWPGAIDGHVHFRQPGATYKEDWETGSKAATAGGVTTVLDMPNTTPTTTTKEAWLEKNKIAADHSLCNYGLFFGASPTNIDDANAMHRHVPGLKIFMGCSTGDLLVYKREDLDPIFRDYKGLICVHAESETRLRERTAMYKDRCDCASIHSVIRDNESAREAVELACSLAVAHNKNLHVLHLSTAEELAEIAKWQAKNPNISITCEVCPHHLFLDTSDYETYGTLVRMNPPLRSPEDVARMWEGIKGGEIPMVATDHAPHTLEEKRRPYLEAPSGVPGVETMLPMMLDAAKRGLISYRDVLKLLCQRPAEIYGMEGRGKIEVGACPDLIVIDPEMTRAIRNEEQFSKCAWTPWDSRQTTGWPVMTIVNGVVVFKRDDDGVGEHFVQEKGFAQNVIAH